MIGTKKAGSKTSSVLGALANLKIGAIKNQTPSVSGGAGAQVNWNAIKAAKDLEAARQAFDAEKYKALVRRY
jgi:hypothetical protein